MTSGHRGQAQRYIRSIQRSLRRLEVLLREIESQVPELRPRDPRSDLLEEVHVAGAMEQRQLFELLDRRGINHTWIGAQVGAEYLDLWQAADGRTLYRVTDRAIRELRLGQLASAAAYASLSESSFGDDWQSAEDSTYDRL
ncbi:MAG TPA: hypothetical protein VFR55_08160 [Dehalococcoidia bacterium]|nr:hypothetical protein [Dehalococcoidia bacterium]